MCHVNIIIFLKSSFTFYRKHYLPICCTLYICPFITLGINVFLFLLQWTVNGEKRTFIKELCEMAQTYNGNGNTPLLSACDVYSRTSVSTPTTSTWPDLSLFSLSLCLCLSVCLSVSLSLCCVQLDQFASFLQFFLWN